VPDEFYTLLVKSFVIAATMVASVHGAPFRQADYTAMWDAALPFDRFLFALTGCQTEWKSAFANAAVDADTLTRLRALRGRRRLLVSSNTGCTDSKFTVPYIAKLAAAVPERLELRMEDGNHAGTVRVLILNESNQRLESTDIIGRGKGAINEIAVALEKTDTGRK
jgi:hypothetical protein